MGLSRFTFMQGRPPNMDGVIFNFVEKREKARVDSQRIQNRFITGADWDNSQIWGCHIWGWQSRCCQRSHLLFDLNHRAGI